MAGRQAGRSPAPPPLLCAQHSRVADEGDILEEQPEKSGLLSQLLYIFCALKSLEILSFCSNPRV